MEGALVKVLNIFAGYRSVDLRDDVPVTHPHLGTHTALQTRPVFRTDRNPPGRDICIFFAFFPLWFR